MKPRIELVERGAVRHQCRRFFVPVPGGTEINGRPVGQVDAESLEQAVEIAGPADRHRDTAYAVFQHKVPSDDPGDQFPEGGVGIRIGTAGDGYEGGEFGVTEGGEAAGGRGHGERDDHCRAGARAGGVAGDGGADGGEDARADDDPDAEEDKLKRAEDLFKRVARFVAFRQDTVEVFEPEQLPRKSFHRSYCTKKSPIVQDP